MTVVAILAGGRASRMGGAKAGAVLGGRTLLHRAVGAGRAAGLATVVVAKRDVGLPPVDAEVWLEPDEPRHPLAGVAHALRTAGEPVVVAPVDLPLVPPALLLRLAGRPEPLAHLAVAGRDQPLLARVDPVHADALAAAARDGAPVLRTLRGLGAVVLRDADVADLGDPARMVLNVNDAADLAAAEALLAAEARAGGAQDAGAHDPPAASS